MQCIVFSTNMRTCSHVDSQGNAQDVADFYNAQPNAGLVQRRRSKIFHMRTMNNWIKSVLINKSLGLLGDEQTRLRVLDLCCGKGGDLLKWKKHRLGHLAAIGMFYLLLFHIAAC